MTFKYDLRFVAFTLSNLFSPPISAPNHQITAQMLKQKVQWASQPASQPSLLIVFVRCNFVSGIYKIIP